MRSCICCVGVSSSYEFDCLKKKTKKNKQKRVLLLSNRWRHCSTIPLFFKIEGSILMSFFLSSLDVADPFSCILVACGVKMALKSTTAATSNRRWLLTCAEWSITPKFGRLPHRCWSSFIRPIRRITRTTDSRPVTISFQPPEAPMKRTTSSTTTTTWKKRKTMKIHLSIRQVSLHRPLGRLWRQRRLSSCRQLHPPPPPLDGGHVNKIPKWCQNEDSFHLPD